MAKQASVPGKVQKLSKTRFKIEADGPGEVDVDLDLLVDGNYEVDKLETTTLPTNMPPPENTPIRWFNNFSIKQDGQYINQRYLVTIPGLVTLLGKSKLVIYSDTHDPKLYDYGAITGDTFELTDGDPGSGGSPP